MVLRVQEGEVIVNFYDPSNIVVEFEVPLSTLKSVQDGSPVFVNEQRYPLTHIQKMLDDETRMAPAYIKIQCPDCIIGARCTFIL